MVGNKGTVAPGGGGGGTWGSVAEWLMSMCHTRRSLQGCAAHRPALSGRGWRLASACSSPDKRAQKLSIPDLDR